MDICKMFDNKFCDFKNLLLYTPFDKRFKSVVPKEFSEYMDECNFLSTFYVEDKLQKEFNILNNQKVEISSRENNSEEDIETLELIENKIIYILNEINKKNNFEENIKNISQKPFLIRGLSGSGKTTYLHNLMHHMDNIWINYDLFESSKEFILFEKNWRNEKFNFTLFKILSLLLKRINTFLERGELSENEYKKKIRKIYDNYKALFYDRGIQIHEELFVILYEYLNGKFPYKKAFGSSEHCLLDKLYRFFINICDFDKQSPINQINISDILTELLQITVVLLICLYYNEKSETNKNSMPLIFISFDNIEHYIDDNKVYDEDIVELSTIIYDFMNAQQNILPIDFYEFFRIILLVRDTTDKMLNPNYWHDEDFPNNSVDISEWFDTLEIYNKKIEYFKERKVLDKYSDIEKICKALKFIFEDNIPSGLNTTIANIYNNNKRRTTMYLIEALITYAERTDRYIELWTKAQSCDNNEYTQIYKHAARSIIKRSLFDLIQSKNYLSDLDSPIKDNRTLGFGLARRFMTILYRLTLQLNENTDGYIGFSTLLRYLFISPTHGVENEESIRSQISILVEILFLLNNSSIEETKWCQLIDVKLNRKAFTSQNKTYLNDIMYKAYSTNSDEEGIGVKITNAGKTLLAISSEFEYFMCKYKTIRNSLFCTDDLRIALNSIQEIKKQTFKYIKTTKELDLAFVSVGTTYNFNAFYSSDDLMPSPYLYISSRNISIVKECHHVVRIIDSHISYIDMYRTCVLSSNITESTTDELLRFSNGVLQVISNYVNLLKELVDINSKCNGKKTYYIGGYRRSKGELYYENKPDYDGKCFYNDYLIQLEKAQKKPLDPTIRIIKKEKGYANI